MAPAIRRRGSLRVYLGAAPGVGKTFAMLDEGRRRAARGTDVVIGFVETHGRPRTAAQLGDLEVVPRRSVDYRDTTHEEMDLPAILLRNPEVALVDELAHTNIVSSVPGEPVPVGGGADNVKRWQDIEQLLAAGVCVITTVNIQHLESLNDVVESITGIRQRETVPDRIVRQADAIELVDMSPQALRRRMAHGNIYAPEKVEPALGQFFREGNLTALRELALLWLADRVDEGLESYRTQHEIESTWATRERVVVAVSGGAESEVLLRRAARITSRKGGGEWLALYVTRGDGLVQTDPERLHRMHVMTQDMGGTFHTVVGDDPATAILDFARAENATQVLIGASRRGRLASLGHPGVGDTVIAESGDIDVHIVTHEQAQRKASIRAKAKLSRRRRLVGYLVGVGGPFGLSGLLLLTPGLHGLPTEAMLFMALVVATAFAGGHLPAIASSLVGGFSLNFFFTPPLRTITIASPENAFAVFLFVFVGIAVSSVVGLATRRTAQAERASAEADALAVLSHSLLHARDFQTLLENACELFGMRGSAIVGRDGATLAAYGDTIDRSRDADVTVEIDENTSLCLVGRPLPASSQRLLKSFAVHASVLGERRRALQESNERRVLAETDRTRTALLAAVSHDLRSPLATVKAAVSSLRNEQIHWSTEDEEALLATVEEGADRLEALVANLLDMSRIRMGAVKPHVDQVELEATIAAAVASVTGGERVRVAVAADAALIVADAGLLERVLANLVGNALAYTPSKTDVRIDAVLRGGRAIVRVVDVGPGVPAELQEHLFEAFQRLGDVPRGEGVGLGLAVARGLTEAMGGALTAEDTPGGGLTFVLDLPMSSTPTLQEAT